VRRPLRLLVVVLVSSLWSAALVAAPVAAAPRLSALTYAGASRICHQQPARSFHVDGAQFPVCARCLGLYLGAVVGALAWCVAAGTGRVASKRAVRWVNSHAFRVALVVIAAPTLVSVALAWLGVWDGNNVVRATLAVPLGAIIAMAITAVAAGDLR
jgi:uncharacterized membrane protein